MTSKSKTPPEAVDAGIVLMRLGGERDLVENRIRAQAHRVIKAGGSWTTVAAALGISRQAAWERYRIVPPAYVHPLDAKR